MATVPPMSNPVTPAYLAGMMDADGHFGWRAGKHQAPQIGVTNTSVTLMEALKGALGGSIGTQRRECSPSCSLDHIHRRMATMKWHVVGFRAVLVCEALLPHLIVKADKARALIDQYGQALATMERPARREHHMALERAAFTWGWD